MEKKWSDLTDEQKKEVDALLKSTKKGGLLFSLQIIAMMLISNALILILDYTSIHSATFCFICGLANGWFIGNYIIRTIKEEHEEIRKKVKEIVNK